MSSAENGRELLLAALRHEAVPRAPWVPFAGVHAGKLKGYSAVEVLTDRGKLLESLLEVHRQYRPDGQPVLFDLQLEAEILGCDLAWAEKAPPSVASHPLASRLEVPSRLPESCDGRLPLVLEVTRELKRAVGGRTALYGLTCGPLTLACHLRSTALFLDFFDNPGFLHELIAFTARVARRMAEFYIGAGADVIAIVDPVVSQISAKHFGEFVSQPCRDLFDFIRAAGVYSSFFVCGDATRNIEPMCRTGPDSISIDENIDLPRAKAITDRFNITIGGNVPLSSVMLNGTQADNMRYVVDLLDRVGYRNLIVAPGCDMPYDVPPENAIGVLSAVREPGSVRRLLAEYHSAELELDVPLPDYGRLDRPLVEVFTVDSATCPACGYMAGAARNAKEHFGDRVEVVEYKTVERASLARARKMGVKSLPSLFINGRLVFSSIIPSSRELWREIERFL